LIKVVYSKESGLTQSNGSGFNIFGLLLINNGINFAPQTFAEDATIGENNIIFGDATNGKITLTLPNAITNFGRWICLKKIDATGNIVDIIPANDQNIDGQIKLSIIDQNNSFTIVASGSNWYLI